MESFGRIQWLQQKNRIESFNNRVYQAEEIINELEDRVIWNFLVRRAKRKKEWIGMKKVLLNLWDHQES